MSISSDIMESLSQF